MYTLLLVDDEEDVIEVIERKVSWEQIGFHVVGHAGILPNRVSSGAIALGNTVQGIMLRKYRKSFVCGQKHKRYPCRAFLLARYGYLCAVGAGSGNGCCSNGTVRRKHR